MRRRDTLRELMNPSGTPEETDEAASTSPPRRAEPVRPGALRTMGLSLKQMSAEADDARALRAQLESGQQVVELDPGLVDPSFVADRIPVERDPGFDGFVQSIAEAGQQVPILVRPHPDAAGRYQAAYGHRRLRAAAALRRNVRAIVRTLTDTELVVAQGKENGERRDLSFIERATFAAHLEARGFERPTIMVALGVDKADLSRLIALAKAVPGDVVRAIGPAPKTGRPRWTQFVELFEAHPEAADRLASAIAETSFVEADSDRRFALALGALRTHPVARAAEAWHDAEGRAVVRIETSATATRLVVDERLGPGFGAFLVDRLAHLHREFAEARDASAHESPTPTPSRAAKRGARQTRRRTSSMKENIDPD